jgi:MoaA/NifB/PqqE/SkfB family radical SAM enzyme
MGRGLMCTRPWTSFRIENHKGLVQPCCYTRVICGNVNDQTIEEIWNGEMYQDLRRRIASGRSQRVCPFDCPVVLGQETEPDLVPIGPLAQANRSLQLEEIRTAAVTLKSFPVYFRVTPTVTCNLNCSFCYQKRNDSVELPGNLDSALEAQFSLIQELEIVGGEPLVSPECLKLMARMDRRHYPGLHLALITNGTAITESALTLLHERRISWMLVSVDAATPETYAKVRGGDFSSVVKGVQRLQKLRRDSGENWQLKMNFTVMRNNMHEAALFPDFAASLGVDFQFTPVHGTGHRECFYHIPGEVVRAQQTLAALQNSLEASGTHDHGIARTRLVLRHAALRGYWR